MIAASFTRTYPSRSNIANTSNELAVPTINLTKSSIPLQSTRPGILLCLNCQLGHVCLACLASNGRHESRLGKAVHHGHSNNGIYANTPGTPGQRSKCSQQIVACHVGQPRANVKTMLIAFTNTKGGVGKSTLASHLALWLFDQSYRVALLDTDEQGTASAWVSAAEPSLTVVTATEMEAIQQARANLLASHDIVVADTPGKESDAARTVTLLCDLAIVPLQPSKPDIRAIKDALKNIRLAQEISGKQRPEALLVLNLTAKLDVQTKALREQLQTAGFPVARTMVRRLNAFRDACDTSVTRMRPSEGAEAARDIKSLFTEILGDKLSKIPQINQSSLKKVANE